MNQSNELARRRIGRKTVEAFQIISYADRLEYPVHYHDGSLCPRRRVKNLSGTGAKYRWEGTGDIPVAYNLHRYVSNPPDRLVVANGEVEVWILHQCGVPAISFFGESRVREIGIRPTILTYPDRDKTGQAMPKKIANALYVPVTVYELPFPLVENHGKDLCDFWLECQNEQGFMTAISLLPKITIYPKRNTRKKNREFAGQSVRWQEYLSEITRALGYNEDDFNAQGWAKYPTTSPFRRDDNPSFVWHYGGTGKDFATGETFNAISVGSQLGLTWRGSDGYSPQKKERNNARR